VRGAAHKLSELAHRHLAEHRLAADQCTDYRTDRARHPHPPLEWDRGALKDAAELLLDVLVLSLMALAVLELLERTVVALMK
jgi:hypothetical protein